MAEPKTSDGGGSTPDRPLFEVVSPTPLFDLGRTVFTPAAERVMAAYGDPRGREPGMVMAMLLDRHVRGDFGDIDADDAEDNTEAIKTGQARVFSVYHLPDADNAVWVITEWDRSVTTALLPSDY